MSRWRTSISSITGHFCFLWDLVSSKWYRMEKPKCIGCLQNDYELPACGGNIKRKYSSTICKVVYFWWLQGSFNLLVKTNQSRLLWINVVTHIQKVILSQVGSSWPWELRIHCAGEKGLFKTSKAKAGWEYHCSQEAWGEKISTFWKESVSTSDE